MNRDPILFRVDGTAGGERLTRCLTYAAALQRRRRPTYVLGQLEPRSLALAVKRTGSNWLEADGPAGTEEDLAEVLQEVRRLNPAAVIVDADVQEGYLNELIAAGCLVVSMDHRADIRFPSHLVINPLLGPGREAYEFAAGTQLLLGQRYALIRSEIRRIRPVRAQEPPTPFAAVISLDDDPQRKAGDIARMLLNVSRLERVDIVARPEHPALPQYQELAAACPDRLKIASEPAEIVSRISRCHFAVTAGGGHSQELACVGVPQLVVVQDEGNWPTAQLLEEEGVAICLGWHENISASAVRQAVQNLLNDPFERQAMARCGRQLIDGRGPDRLVTALEVMLHPSRLVHVGELGEEAA